MQLTLCFAAVHVLLCLNLDLSQIEVSGNSATGSEVRGCKFAVLLSLGKQYLINWILLCFLCFIVFNKARLLRNLGFKWAVVLPGASCNMSLPASADLCCLQYSHVPFPWIVPQLYDRNKHSEKHEETTDLQLVILGSVSPTREGHELQAAWLLLP